jgi:hypothetical protein
LFVHVLVVNVVLCLVEVVVVVMKLAQEVVLTMVDLIYGQINLSISDH